jgi:hypothetical protein
MLKRTKANCGQATKGLRWIPRHRKAMKDVVTDDTLRGVGSKHRSEDFRMGQPYILPVEYIDGKERTQRIETS